MHYRSKIDWWFYMIVAFYTVVTVLLWILFFINGIAVLIFIGVLFACIDFMFIIPLMFDTRYIINNDYLHIKSWLCCNTKIDYSKILSFKETRNADASPALSMDRLEILFFSDKGKRRIIISPVNKMKFIEELQLRIKQT